MSQDARNSAAMTLGVVGFVLIGAALLLLLRGVNMPSWMPVVLGVLGVLNLALFGRQLWLRRFKEHAGLRNG
ncbi:hypothetical protein IAG41_04045 [Sphingomonas sp. JC676]|uniref:hypothetical protein n=1 Tax=Sphingomonas sp. JC676 TaxID=2768065 RepID=UPI00165864DC|nr:hypothetical protein [Sphingomonas sp. JC676]MBC9031556.1 hypothetical protein [Sphingomonas sp. JC676]